MTRVPPATRFAILPLAMIIISFMSARGDALAAGGSMTNGGSYTGSVTRGQVDQWTFSATKGDAIVLTASEVGSNTPFYPYLQVQAPDGKIAGNHAGDLVARVDLIAEQTGTYTARVSRYYPNDGGGQYVLALAQAPEPFIVPAGDEGGQMTNGGTYTGNVVRGPLNRAGRACD
jgi:hypothetical protein